jgi:hypothetical protein
MVDVIEAGYSAVVVRSIFTIIPPSPSFWKRSNTEIGKALSRKRFRPALVRPFSPQKKAAAVSAPFGASLQRNMINQERDIGGRSPCAVV